MQILVMGNAVLAQALAARGHTVLVANETGKATVRLEHPITAGKLWQRLRALGHEPDLLFYQDDGNLPVLVDPERAPCPAIYYAIDTYCNPWQVGYAKGFDRTLVAQKDFLALFTGEGVDAHWFPLFAAWDQDFQSGAAVRDVPVSFVGTLGHHNNPDREPFLKCFQRLQPLIMRTGAYREIFGRSRIVLNQTAFGEINFRCFEAMACGAPLLTERCANGFTEIFAPGVNILPPYARNNASEAAAIAREWLDRPEQLAAIGAAGREHVRKYHSTMARAATLESMALELADTAADKAAKVGQRRYFVRSSFGMIAAELTETAMTPWRDFYLRLAQDIKP